MRSARPVRSAIRTKIREVWKALADKNTRVVAQIATGCAGGEPVMHLDSRKVKMRLGTPGGSSATAWDSMRSLTPVIRGGPDGHGRVCRIPGAPENRGRILPLLTSCCPAWVKFVQDQFPDYKENISTCRSPQQMFSAVIKEYYRNPEHAEGKKTVVVSIMPCTAKKMEAERPNSYTKGEKDTDIVITTTELTRMIRTAGIALDKIEVESCDMPFGIASGAGVIFGVTGGVTEAVIRRLVPGHGNAVMDSIAEAGMRGEEGIKEFSITYEGKELNICVASGLANARKVMEQVQSGEKQYHLIEIMACRRGCIMGGGQPIPAGPRHKEARAKGLYRADGNMAIKKCTENPLMDVFYNGEDFKGKAHELLHNPF